MYYQKNPIYTIVIIGIGISLYIFFRSRKGKGGILGKFLGGTRSDTDERMDDLITLFMLQQMFNNSPQRQARANGEEDNIKNKRYEEIEKTKQEILDLLERD